MRDKFELKVKKDLIFIALVILLIPCMMIIMNTFFGEFVIDDNFSGFIWALVISSEVILFYYLVTWSIALRNESRMEILFIKSNDERNKFIKKETAINTVVTFVIFMIFALIWFAYKNALVFEVLFYILNVFIWIFIIFKVKYKNTF